MIQLSNFNSFTIHQNYVSIFYKPQKNYITHKYMDELLVNVVCSCFTVKKYDNLTMNQYKS